jgi:Cd2+/Zn2+-exporting ATPase
MEHIHAAVSHSHAGDAACACGSCAQIVNFHNHGEEPEPALSWWRNPQLLAVFGSVLLLAPAAAFSLTPFMKFGLFLASYLLVGSEILIKAGRNLVKGRVFDEYFLMSAATIGAFIIGEYLEGVAVMLLFQVGEFFQDLAVHRSKRSIRALLNIRPDYAHVQVGAELITVSPEQVQVGERVVVKPGERVPLDGVVVEGVSTIDTSALTGESMPRHVQAGDEVLSGSINNSGLLAIEVRKSYQQSTATRIIELVQSAASKKTTTENLISKLARYYTPAVVILAVVLAFLPPLVLAGASFSEWGYRALVFLIISCPCALVISIPLSFFGGIGAASRHGILVKGSNYLDAFNELGIIAFDKTGTLTQGKFKVTQIVPEGISEAELLHYAAYAESYSNHPIAISIREAYGEPVDQSLITDYQELPGLGITTAVNGQAVIAGNERIMAQHGIAVPDVIPLGSVVHVAVNGRYAGYILVADPIKPEAATAIAQLKVMGIDLVMLSGDNHAHAEAVAREMGIGQVYAELLPQDKVNIVEKLLAKRNGKLAFVGDGINDAPVLARADIGIAMGGLGSDTAIEAADVVFMTDEIGKLAASIQLAKYTRKVVWQNIALALGIKALFLILGALGAASLWEAVFADVGVTLIAVINASRVLRAKV